MPTSQVVIGPLAHDPKFLTRAPIPTTDPHAALLCFRLPCLSCVFLIGILPLMLLGCGGKRGPELSESQNFLVEARKAVANGDYAKALEALDASIESDPMNDWAYLERAKVNAMSGNDEAALADCKTSLEFAPKSRDVPWIKGELKKSVDKRFKGRFAIPPSNSK